MPNVAGNGSNVHKTGRFPLPLVSRSGMIE
jgi:hypothetical protein